MTQKTMTESNHASGEFGGLYRMDFKIEVVRRDDESRTALFRLLPDPRRYDKISIDGEIHYVDKYLHTTISEKLLLQTHETQVPGLPMYSLSASIESALGYAASRKIAIEGELRGHGYVPPEEKPLAHQPLKIGTEQKSLVFISVDICESTALRQADHAGFDRAYELFLRELGTVVGQFNGALLKTTGDGFIAYIDHPSFTQQCDHAIDMGLTFLVVLRESINPALNSIDLPALRIRVGADYGEAVVREVKIVTTGFSAPEIASDALNRAVKIEQSSSENEFRIGRRLFELIHVQWLERAAEVSFDGASVGFESYKVYKVQ